MHSSITFTAEEASNKLADSNSVRVEGSNHVEIEQLESGAALHNVGNSKTNCIKHDNM